MQFRISSVVWGALMALIVSPAAAQSINIDFGLPPRPFPATEADARAAQREALM